MVWLGAIVSLCFIPGWTGAIIPTQYAVLSMFLPFTMWRHGSFTVFHWLGLAFVAYAVASLLWNTDPYGGVYGIWLVCTMALSFWFGSTLQSLRNLYVGLTIGGAVSSALAVAHWLGFQLVPSASGPPAGILVNSTVQGGFLALMVVALLTERMYLYAVPLIPGLVLSQSRGAWLALVIGVIAVHIRSTWLLVLTALAVTVVVLLPNTPSDAERLWIWTAAFNELTFFGNGAGSFASQMYSNGLTPKYPEFVHNDMLQLIYEFGCFALLPFAIFGFALSQTQAREWPVVLSFVILGLCSFPLWMPLVAFVGLVAAGRVVRNWGMGWRFSNYCGSAIASRQRFVSGAIIPLVGANKGSC